MDPGIENSILGL